MLVESQSGESVEGVLYLDVSPADISLLDSFEGAEYLRRPVHVLSENSERPYLPAEAYVATELGRCHCDTKLWDRSAFEAEGLARFCEKYIGFSNL